MISTQIVAGVLVVMFLLALMGTLGGLADATKKGVGSRRALWIIIAHSLFLFSVFALFIVDGFVYQADWLYSPYLAPIKSLPIQVVGIVVTAFAVVLFFVAVGGLVPAFSGNQEPQRVATSGIYALVRHPIYLSYFLTPIGMFLMTLNVLGLLFVLAYFVWPDHPDLEVCGRRRGQLTSMFKIIECEEQALLQRFGSTYQDYRERTGKLLPKLRRR